MLQHDSTPPTESKDPLPEPTVVNSVPDKAFVPLMLVKRRKRNPRAMNPANQALKGSFPIAQTLNPIFESTKNPYDQLPKSQDPISEPTLEPTVQIDTEETATVITPLSTTCCQHLHDKASPTGKFLGNPEKTSFISLVGRKPYVTAHQHEASSSNLPRVSLLSRVNFGPHAVILNPSKHQVVHLHDNEHPHIPVAAVTGGQTDHGSVAMVE
ncbi:hypothetical protein V6N13_048961 [Hibiscus sabdariffa]